MAVDPRGLLVAPALQAAFGALIAGDGRTAAQSMNRGAFAPPWLAMAVLSGDSTRPFWWYFRDHTERPSA